MLNDLICITLQDDFGTILAKEITHTNLNDVYLREGHLFLNPAKPLHRPAAAVGEEPSTGKPFAHLSRPL